MRVTAITAAVSCIVYMYHHSCAQSHEQFLPVNHGQFICIVLYLGFCVFLLVLLVELVVSTSAVPIPNHSPSYDSAD